MTRPEGTSRQGLHELPLVGFTALATAAGGVGTAHLLLALLALVPFWPGRELLLLSTVLYLSGLVFSTGHLGRPLRAPRALRRLGKSPLSNEVAVVGVALGTTALSALAPLETVALGWLAGAAMVSGLLTLLSLGMVYRLPGQLAWRGTASLQPLALGTGFGLVLHLWAPGAAELPIPWIVVLSVFLADSALTWLASVRVERAALMGEPSHPRWFNVRRRLLLGRLLLGDLGPVLALLSGLPPLALVSITLALILDRMMFYALVVRRSTEAEVSRVEGVLRGRVGTHAGVRGLPEREGKPFRPGKEPPGTGLSPG